jgi:hypothetical protein
MVYSQLLYAIEKRNTTARSSTFNFARTSQNQKSFLFPTATQTK